MSSIIPGGKNRFLPTSEKLKCEIDDLDNNECINITKKLNLKHRNILKDHIIINQIDLM